MEVTVTKTSFERFKPRVLNYRDHKSFKNKLFTEELLYELSNATFEENADGFEKIVEICQKTLNHHAPTKQKLIQGNHLPFINKDLSKAIMHGTRFRNKYLKKKPDENKRKYAKQRNYYASLLRKSKREYCSSLDVKNITGNKTFWKTVKSFLSDRVTSTQKITLIDNDKTVKNDDDTERVLKTFFSKIVTDLKIPRYNNSDPLAEKIQEPDRKKRNHTHYRRSMQNEPSIIF